MGTRGFVGFVIDGTEKIAYNHFDSYPGGLGLDVLHWLHVEPLAEPDATRKRARALRVVANDSEPTDENIEQLQPFYNPNVGGHKDRPDWYQLLRETQGNLGLILKAGVTEDASHFPLDSLFAEWGYIVDFDAGVFEVYAGFQRSPHSRGRFASREGGRSDGYYPVALVASWPLSELPTDEAFLAIFGEDADS
jgi:hypothetical protein